MQTAEWYKTQPKDVSVGDPAMYPHVTFFGKWGFEGGPESGQEPKSILAVLIRRREDMFCGISGSEGKESVEEALLELQKKVRLHSPTAEPCRERRGR
jgi:hypothetical protein